MHHCYDVHAYMRSSTQTALLLADQICWALTVCDSCNSEFAVYCLCSQPGWLDCVPACSGMTPQTCGQPTGGEHMHTFLSPHLKRTPWVNPAGLVLPDTAEPAVSAPANAQRTPGGMYCVDQRFPTISSALLDLTPSAACRIDVSFSGQLCLPT